jgi:hypothetical protein
MQYHVKKPGAWTWTTIVTDSLADEVAAGRVGRDWRLRADDWSGRTVDDFLRTRAQGASVKRPLSKSYIARHWRGELSLPRSFWLNGVLLTFGVLFAAMNLVKTGVSLFHANSRAGFALVLVGYALWFLITIPVAVWQLVGVARSATNYTGSRVWEIFAKSVCGLGWLALFYSLTHVPAVVAVIIKISR